MIQSIIHVQYMCLTVILLNHSPSPLWSTSWSGTRYTASIINWRKDELEAMDRKTRKMMTIYNSLHPRADVDRLYIPRKHGGRGQISKQESVYMEEQCRIRYIDITEEE